MTTATVPHPAKWSQAVLDAVSANAFELFADHVRLLDPFAGVGTARLSAAIGHDVIGVELEPEWASQAGDLTFVGNALRLPFPSSSFDGMITSPSYANRMADSHDAKDRCKPCDGTGLADALDRLPCKQCRGSGLSRRNTYTHTLGRKPSPDASTTLQWGDAYRRFHEAAWRECDRVLKPGAFVFLNVKNHQRDGKEKHVAEWHLNTWLMLGASIHHVERVRTPGNRFGQNGDARVPDELLIVLTTRSA